MGDDTQKSSRVARAALVLGVLSTFLGIMSTVVTFYRTSSAGQVEAVEPLSGYAIVRGVDPTYPGEPDPKKGLGVGPYPSDHMVLPVEWSNGTGSPVLIKNPRLVLHELGQNGDPTGDSLEFFLVGEFPEASITVFNNVNEKPYDFTNSIVLEPHSVRQSVLVFRIRDWAGANQCFRFHQGQRYQADLVYNRIPQDPRIRFGWLLAGRGGEPTTQVLVDNLPILDTANLLSPYGKGSIGWDYVSLLPGSRATTIKHLREDTTKYYTEPEPCS